MKKLSILFAALLFCACSNNEEPSVKSGTAQSTNDKMEKATVKIQMVDDKLKKVEIDETANDSTKRKLGDEYKMKQASTIGKEWYEQVDYLQKYILENGVDSIKTDKQGKAENDDVLSGCTITIDEYLRLVKDAITNAK